jgi:hypothetical protein
MRISLNPLDQPFKMTWYPDPWDGGTLPIEGQFTSSFQLTPDLIDGQGDPGLDKPEDLPKLGALPSQKIVTSVLGASLIIGGTEWVDNLASMDLMRPLNGETQGRLSLLSSVPSTLDPEKQGSIKAGQPLILGIEYAGLAPQTWQGWVVEPPKFQVIEGNVGSLEVRIGDLFLLKRQSENVSSEIYCGPLPRTTATAAQVFARVRGLPGTWGGEALVEGVSPDFVEGAPWEFLSSLYEVLDYDVRSSAAGSLAAFPRPTWNLEQALVIENYQAIEARLDSPAQLPYSQVIGYNSFERDLGFKTRSTQETDFSSWDPSNTEPWFRGNNTYRVIKSRFLGDTLVGETQETWGYLPNNTLLPQGSIPQGTTGPCGQYTPPPDVEQVTTRLDIIESRNTNLYFEPHISGGYVVTGRESSLEGWAAVDTVDGDTLIYFGPQEAIRENYGHFASPVPRVCPQYFPIYRTYSEITRWNRVKKENIVGVPEYQLTQRSKETWIKGTEEITEGQITQWLKVSETSSYDASLDRWIGGSNPQEQGDPPNAQFIRSLKVPVNIETTVILPEVESLVGPRLSKPVQFPNAYTDRDLIKATERFARETSGLALSIHLLLDPRIPVQPGTLIRYRRDDSTEIHGICWSVETNITGNQATQSVVIMRTFTEPALFAIRSNQGYVPRESVNYQDPCL